MKYDWGREGDIQTVPSLSPPIYHCC
jgi:hypothetical protein